MIVAAWSSFAFAFIMFSNVIVHSLLKGTIEKYRLRVISSVIVAPAVFLYWGMVSTSSSLFFFFLYASPLNNYFYCNDHL